MRRRSKPETSDGRSVLKEQDGDGRNPDVEEKRLGRPAFVWLALFVLFLNGSWAVYHVQVKSLPFPSNAEQAGKRGFSEVLAMEHVKNLTVLGPHPVGSEALELAIKYVFAEAEKIKKTAHWEVDVQVDLFHVKGGVNNLHGGIFKGKTLIYSDLKHVVLKILPKYLPEAEEDLILVSSHIDTVISAEGAGDDSSCVGVMLELARGISQWAHGFKKGVVFLFNTGEEEGLNGAHSFMTQHPWRSAIRLAIDLETMGIGGKSSIFQVGKDPWAIETYAKVAKYPSGLIVAQDLFHSGAINSATDFQVYQEIGGLSGLDFAYTDATAVYHTKNDKIELLKPGSLQHLGENMLVFLIHSSMSSSPEKGTEVKKEEGNNKNRAIYFDILGMYMVVYTQRLSSMLHNSVIMQSILILSASLLMGGYHGLATFFLSCLSIILMWIFSLSLSFMVAVIIPFISDSSVPYIAHPWIVIGLFGSPAVLGALFGQYMGFLLIIRHLKNSVSQGPRGLLTSAQARTIKLEAERWLFKSGFVQWLVLLVVGTYFKAGSSYIALVWLVSPAFAYGLMEATLSPLRSPKQLKVATLIIGLIIPVILSAGVVIQLLDTLIGNIVRLERNPGSNPDWLANAIVAVLVSAIVCLTLVYLLSYIHLSGAKGPLVISMCMLLTLALAAVSSGFLPPYTEDIARTVNVVHVVEGKYHENQPPLSYISLFSNTPGKLTEELRNLKDEGFNCGKSRALDFVTFDVKYGCWSSEDTEIGWEESEIPIIDVESDSSDSGDRITRLFIDTKLSRRWALGINKEEIRDFTFEVDSDELVPLGVKEAVDGWHTIQFSGGMNAPAKFHLNLYWVSNATRASEMQNNQAEVPPLLVKLRTDVNRVTPKVNKVLQKLPPWCSQFGKSTSPYTLAFLASLPVQF